MVDQQWGSFEQYNSLKNHSFKNGILLVFDVEMSKKISLQVKADIWGGFEKFGVSDLVCENKFDNDDLLQMKVYFGVVLV